MPKKRGRSKLEIRLKNQILQAGLPQPTEEFLFASRLGRRFRADFCWEREKLIVEVNGGITGGRHVYPSGYTQDRLKAALAQILGYRYIEVVPQQIANRTGIALISFALTGQYEGIPLDEWAKKA